jgi:hypothetical protein
MVNKVNILIKQIEQRISELEADALIDKSKKAALIRENKKFLLKCQKLVETNSSCEKPFIIKEGCEKGNLRTITTSRPNVMPAPQN